MMQKTTTTMTAAEQQSYLEELELEFIQIQSDLSETLLANNVLSGKIEQKEQELLQTEVMEVMQFFLCFNNKCNL